MKRTLLLVFLISLTFSGISTAQYYSFGKNRVQYEDFEWRYIQSKHFDVYYYGSKNYELAEFATLSVESAYLQLKKDFNHEISDRLSLIIYNSHNDFSQTNVVALPINAEGIGGVTDKLKNRMTVPFAGDYNDFRRTIHHELVHAVFNDMFYGGNAQAIISNNIQLSFPLWFEEGLAEYTALGWDTNTDMFIRDAVINNYLAPIRYLNGYYAYRGGQSVWNYIVEEYGREKIAEILSRIRTSRSVETGINLSLGLTIDELSEKWQEALKKRYYPEVAERESAESIATLLTRRGDYGTYNTSPAISPQGDKVAFITNSRGYFDVVVISTINGRKLKTLIRGEDNVEFEELNILNPNLTWSPDGSKIALSTKTKGNDDIAIIDYETKEVEKIKFKDIDAIHSVSWSPNGRYLAFDGNIGPYQDIFVYDFETRKVTNLTKDFFSDTNPNWSGDSKTVYFVSDRSDKVQLGEYTTDFNLLASGVIYQTDIYSVDLGSGVANRITNTPNWNEKDPAVTRDGRLLYISDENGIQNIYQLDPDTRVSVPLTDFQAGASQISVSADGSRLAFGSINKGYLDVFLLKSPFSRVKEEPLTDNYWAQRRARESQAERVPATALATTMFDRGVVDINQATTQVEDQTQTQEEKEEEASVDNIDFRNYVFSEEVIQDTTLRLRDVETFTVEDNITDDGRYIPKEYRLKFELDIAYSPQFNVSTYGSYALTQFLVSDLLGDHQLSFGTNFVFDLRNSDYSIQYGNFKNRTNYLFNYFHTSRRYQTFFGELIRYRIYGGGATIQYPMDKFRRIDLNLSAIGVVLDYNTIFDLPNSGSASTSSPSESSLFMYPQFTYTVDKTLPGFITPQGGTRYSVGLSGSPGLGDSAPIFASVLGDFRHYVNLGQRYSLAFRYSGGASIGSDSQTYFMGGRLGWLNQQWSGTGVPTERLTDSFFSLPVLPLRGFEYNTLYGNKFSLINAEFRFPLFAAIVPGAVPILPLYNITGVAFVDAGTAWGEDINYGLNTSPDLTGSLVVNDASLNFNIAKERTGYGITQQGGVGTANYWDGDILIGAGFGLRSIFLGLPFGYDIGWAFDGTGFKSKPVHYFSIGIDF